MYPLDSSISWFWHSILKRDAEFHPVKPWIVELFIGMENELIITLYFNIIAVITLFLLPPYLLAVTELHRIVFKNSWKTRMLVFLTFFFNNWSRSCALFAPLFTTTITGAESLTPRCYSFWLSSPILSRTGTGTLHSGSLLFYCTFFRT